MKDFRIEIAKAWRQFRHPYRPELYYMRGPGPRTLERERQVQAASSGSDASSSRRRTSETQPG